MVHKRNKNYSVNFQYNEESLLEDLKLQDQSQESYALQQVETVQSVDENSDEADSKSRDFDKRIKNLSVDSFSDAQNKI